MRPLIFAIAFALLPAPSAFAQALDTSLPTSAPPGTLGPPIVPQMRSLRICPGNSVLAGIRHDQNEILCLTVDPDLFTLGGDSRDAPPPSGGTPASQWPSTAPATLRTANYSGSSMHWCGPGSVMAGYGDGNTFICRSLTPAAGQAGPAPLTALRVDGAANVAGPGHTLTQFPYTDRNGRQNTLHSCPSGWALMGLHLDGNIFLCGLVFPPGAALDISTFVQNSPRGSTTRGPGFSDELLGTIGGVRPFQINCTGAAITLRDRFGRNVDIAAGSRGAVALDGRIQLPSGNTPVAWRCGGAARLSQCPSAVNVIDVGRFDAGFLIMRCLRRTPAPWTP